MTSILYPRAPYELVTAWENVASLEQNPTVIRKNGGAEARGTNFQLNRLREIQEVKVNLAGMGTYLNIEGFLKEREGKPFSFGIYLYSVKTWEWVFKGGAGVNAVFELTCQLRQEFR